MDQPFKVTSGEMILHREKSATCKVCVAAYLRSRLQAA